MGVRFSIVAPIQRFKQIGDLPALDAAPSYTDTFEVDAQAVRDRSAEAWMRAVLEGAPRPLRWFIVAGWRMVLGFRLGPPQSLSHILGWPIVTTSPELVVLEQHSALMTARLVLRVTEQEVTWTTYVHYEHAAARAVWAIVGLLHRRIVPYSLRHAAGNSSP